MIIHAPFSSDHLIACESTRQDGKSQSPFHSRNLGLFTVDEPILVEANLKMHCLELGIQPTQLALSRQVHADQILRMDQPGRVDGYDAMITDQPDVFLGIGTADCCPVLLWDPVRNAVGAVHAGWRGAANQILMKTIVEMKQQFHSNPADLWIYLGTCIGWSRYEIGEEVADQFPEVFLRAGEREDKYFLDLKGCLFTQALAVGIATDHVTASLHCSFDEDELFFSYRRDGIQSGRMLSIIGIRSSSENESTS